MNYNLEDYYPSEIYKELDKSISGQEEYKRLLSVAGYMHISRLCYSVANYDKENRDLPFIQKSNMLVHGPTGCGKTFGVETLAKILSLPYCSIDAKSISNTGYVGKTAESMIKSHLEENMDKKDTFRIPVPGKKEIHYIPIALFSLIFIDEFDKLCGSSDSNLQNWMSSIQHSLLKIVEGKDIKLWVEGEKIHSHTHGMMFFFGGNFQQLRMQRELDKKGGIGFGDTSSVKSTSPHLELMKAGVGVELAGRISQVVEIQELTRMDLRKLLIHKSESILSQYEDLFEFCGHPLQITNYYINKIVDQTLKNKTGARGLQTELDKYVQKQLMEL